MPDLDHVIVGTAGHIDHGKSALVRALTGTDPDTLPEEKARGMTIELGFVFLDDPVYPKQIVFIDVPGHEKFVKTMAAGASNVDAALLVVAADEGIAVQTREHFDILTLLGIELGAVVLTKRDLVDEARLAELTLSVRRFVRGSFLDGAPVLPVSALTGAGIPELKALLQDIGLRVRPRPDSGVFRMPVDRVFTMHGFGTVVAGTVLSGSVRAGDRIEIYPEGLKTRVRGIQVHKSKADASGIGKRTALNLQDLAKEDLRRGQVAAAEGSLVPTSRLDARLDVLAGAPREIKHRDRVRLHIGTDEVMARLSVIGGPTIAPGASSPVQLVLERPAVALPGDRFVIRSFSPIVTVGGGRVLDAAPEKHKRLSGRVLQGLEKLGGTARDAVEQMFAQSTGVPRTVAEIALKLGRAESEAAETIAALLTEGALVAVGTEKPVRYLHRSVRDGLSDALVEGLEAYFTANPFKAEMPFSDVRAAFLDKSDAAAFKHVLDGLVAKGILYRKDAGIGLAGREVRLDPVEADRRARVENAFLAARFSAPLEDDVRAKLGLKPSAFQPILNSLLRAGTLVRLAPKVIYHRDTLEAARRAVAGLIERHGSVSIAELRDRLDLSRKYAQAILEYFDRTGSTKRVGDRHVPA
jgi:selenocysteine-specific elongation factor